MSLPRTVRVIKTQSGKRKSLARDRARTAMPPGLRLSKNNKFYWETRKNRTDIKKI